jgi:hypothetical protein
MVVEVLTAESAEALDKYLAAKELDVKAANLNALDPYMKQDFTLICGWRAESTATARALKIDFTTPHLFYPMQPTRVYQEPVQAAVFVRGWVQPAVALPHARCQYLMGEVGEGGLDEVLGKGASLEGGRYFGYTSGGSGPYFGYVAGGSGREEPLTRIVLDGRRAWEQDLVLSMGAPAGMQVVKAVNDLGRHLYWLVPLVTGVLLSVWLPLAAVPAGKRRAADWLGATMVGAGLCLSIYVAALLFFIWFQLRRPLGEDVRLGRTGKVSLIVAGLAFAALLVAVPLATAVDRYLSKEVVVGLVGVPALILLVALPVAAIAAAYAAAGKRAGWLLAFAAVHGAVTIPLCYAVAAWMGRYA